MELGLRGNNLYAAGYLIEFNTSEGLLLRDKVVVDGSIEDQYYVVQLEDRLDLLAWKFYGNIVDDASKYWWLLADANNIHNPLDLSEFVGKSILIPNILNAQLLL